MLISILLCKKYDSACRLINRIEPKEIQSLNVTEEKGESESRSIKMIFFSGFSFNFWRHLLSNWIHLLFPFWNSWCLHFEIFFMTQPNSLRIDDLQEIPNSLKIHFISAFIQFYSEQKKICIQDNFFFFLRMSHLLFSIQLIYVNCYLILASSRYHLFLFHVSFSVQNMQFNLFCEMERFMNTIHYK